MIKLIRPYISFAEVEDDFKSIFESGWFSKGPFLERFAEDLRRYTGAKHSFLTTSATSALWMCLKVLDVGPGDEVIISDFSFPATANVVEDLGATPVFADVSLDTYNMLPEELERKITSFTKAVIFVDALGNPSGIHKIKEICSKNNIPLIEDAACAIGSSEFEVQCGNIADLTCFSFHPRKLLTTGEGGAITTNNDGWAQKLAVKLAHGAEIENGKCDFVDYGYNFRMSELQAAMGSKQLPKLNGIIIERDDTRFQYLRLLGPLGFKPQKTSEGVIHNCQSVVFLVPPGTERDKLVDCLAAYGVEATIGTYCLSGTSYNQGRYGCAPQNNAKFLQDNTITLPCYEGVDVAAVVEAIEDAISQLSRYRLLHNFRHLPFYFTTAASPNDNADLPLRLPFSIGIDEDSGRIIQCPNHFVSKTLTKAYEKGSLVTGYMQEEGIGRQYADDFLQYILKEVGVENLRGCRVLEIGCGTGYLLHRLKLLGANVCGVEPGAQGVLGSQKYDVNIVQDFFPSEKIKGQFDLIIQYAVLEHIERLDHHMRAVRGHLSRSGKIIVAVPTCDEQIQYGDVSMFLHEHWSYFTKKSLRFTIHDASFDISSLEKSNFGGLWYASAVRRECGLSTIRDIEDPLVLLNRINRNQEIFDCLLRKACKKGSSVGFYCPGRIINALTISFTTGGFDRTKLKARFFDDNPLLQGHYYPGFPYPIESRAQLLQNEPDFLIVASWTFGEKLKAQLIEEGFKGEILSFADLMVW